MLPRVVPTSAPTPTASRGRGLALTAVVVLWVAVVLGLDAGARPRAAAPAGRRHLGAAARSAASRGPATRAQVAVVVAYATVIEYVFSDWLEIYVYRLGDGVPAFVPPGHGLVYLAALALRAQPLGGAAPPVAGGGHRCGRRAGPCGA